MATYVKIPLEVLQRAVFHGLDITVETDDGRSFVWFTRADGMQAGYEHGRSLEVIECTIRSGERDFWEGKK